MSGEWMKSEAISSSLLEHSGELYYSLSKVVQLYFCKAACKYASIFPVACILIMMLYLSDCSSVDSDF